MLNTTQQINQLLTTWEENKQAFAQAFKYKDYQDMNQSSKSLISIAKNIYEILHYKKEEKSNFKNLEPIKNQTNKLIDLIKKTEKAIEDLDVSKFTQHVDKTQSTIHQILTLLNQLINTGDIIYTKNKRGRPKTNKLHNLNQLFQQLKE